MLEEEQNIELLHEREKAVRQLEVNYIFSWRSDQILKLRLRLIVYFGTRTNPRRTNPRQDKL